MPLAAQSRDPQQLKAWLLAAGNKDASVYRQLYNSIASKLFGYTLRILHKQELAE